MESLIQYRESFEGFLQSESLKMFGSTDPQPMGEAAMYALSGGGKRFRPLLCYAVAEAFRIPSQRVAPWALAIEYIHTYSLIHDDLPCMDDDDFRRGRESTHKAFDEATALLAGDALLTDAFTLVSEHYSDSPKLGLPLVKTLSRAAGGQGMVLGQVLDLNSQAELNHLDGLKKIHRLKTGELMGACFVGPGLIANCREADIVRLQKIGYQLGLAFQIKDDLLDEADVEETSFLRFMNLEATTQLLEDVTSNLLKEWRDLRPEGQSVVELIDFNLQRKK